MSKINSDKTFLSLIKKAVLCFVSMIKCEIKDNTEIFDCKNLRKYVQIIGILLLFYIIFVHNLGTYPLLDTDETRYADIARNMYRSKDYITMYLDGVIFWDKPPMYFWLESLSYHLSGFINEWSVRFPVILCALVQIIALYFTLKKITTESLALKSILILGTSLEFVIFSKVAILDMVMTTFITLSLLCGILTYYVAENNKKYFWWGFYVFSALGILSKGIPAFIIPFGTMFFIGLYKKNLREFFKPQHFLIGWFLFFLISLPWHIIMYKIHGFKFIDEYIILHHFKRFIGSNEVDRTEPFYYYLPVFIVGFFPWTMSFLCGLKKLWQEKSKDIIAINLIGFIFTFIFFTLSQTKLVTYILPLYIFSSVLTAYMWDNIKEYSKELRISAIINFVVFELVIIAIFMAKIILNEYTYSIVKGIQIALIFVLLIFLVYLGIGIFRKKPQYVFYSNIILITLLSGFMLPNIFNVWYDFGERDLLNIAYIAKEQNLKLATYDLTERFSLQYYYDGEVLYYYSKIKPTVKKYVKTQKFKKDFSGHVVATSTWRLHYLGRKTKYRILYLGKRFSLIEQI